MTSMPIERISEIQSITRERRSSVEDIRSMFTGNSLIETEEQVLMKIRSYRKLPTFRNVKIDEIKLLETPRKKRLMNEWLIEEKRKQVELNKSHSMTITQADAESFLSLCEVNRDTVSNTEWLDWVEAIQTALNNSSILFDDVNENKENQTTSFSELNSNANVENNNRTTHIDKATLQNTLANSSNFDFAKTQSIFGQKALSPSRKLRKGNLANMKSTATTTVQSSNLHLSDASKIDKKNESEANADLVSLNHTASKLSLTDKYAKVAAKLEIDGTSRDFYGTPLKETSHITTPLTVQEWSSGINGFKRPMQLSSNDEFSKCNTIKKLFPHEELSFNEYSVQDDYPNEQLLQASAIVSAAQVFTTKYRRSPQSKQAQVNSPRQLSPIKIVTPRTSPQKSNATKNASVVKYFMLTAIYWLVIFCCCYYVGSRIFRPTSLDKPLTQSSIESPLSMSIAAHITDIKGENKITFNKIVAPVYSTPKIIQNELELIFNPWKRFWVKVRKIFVTAVNSVQATVAKVPFYHIIFKRGVK